MLRPGSAAMTICGASVELKGLELHIGAVPA
jgi:hypothetical protein